MHPVRIRVYWQIWVRVEQARLGASANHLQTKRIGHAEDAYRRRSCGCYDYRDCTKRSASFKHEGICGLTSFWKHLLIAENVKDDQLEHCMPRQIYHTPVMRVQIDTAQEAGLTRMRVYLSD